MHWDHTNNGFYSEKRLHGDENPSRTAIAVRLSFFLYQRESCSPVSSGRGSIPAEGSVLVRYRWSFASAPSTNGSADASVWFFFWVMTAIPCVPRVDFGAIALGVPGLFGVDGAGVDNQHPAIG